MNSNEHIKATMTLQYFSYFRHVMHTSQLTYHPSYRPHTYGVRLGPCGSFSTEPCRPTACAGITAEPAPNVHYSLYIVHCWIYTFSAKEKDSETGLSYFGSRYYSSDLSIWLSVDPMSDKYASLSPYVYCADNPVKLVDPNGEDIVPYGLLSYYGIDKGGRSRLQESVQVGIYTVTPFYDNNNHLIGYNAVREYQRNGETFWRTEYQMEPSDLPDFKDNIKYYEWCADMIYAYGEPDWRYVAFGSNLMQGQFGAAASIFGSIWQEAFHNPGFWLSMALSTGYSALNMQANSILTNARNGRGCFGLGSASYAEANLAGAKWVGENYRVSSNGRMWISADGLRQYRLPSYKPKLKKYQANFESRNTDSGEWTNNGHLDVNM